MRDLFSWLIGGRKGGNSQKDQIINLKVVSRKLTRSKQKVENQKRKTERNVKDAIRKGDMEMARLHANELVRNRKWSIGYQSLINKIDGLVFKLERADAIQSVAGEMKNVVGTLAQLNLQLNLPEIENVVNNMSGIFEGIEIKTEIMDDSLNDVFETDSDESEVDSLLEEYGVDVGVSVSSDLPTPSSSIGELEKEIEELKNQEDK